MFCYLCSSGKKSNTYSKKGQWKFQEGLGEEGFKNNSKELSWSVGEAVSRGDMGDFPGDFQFYKAKTSNCKKFSKFDWILLMTKIKNYLPLRS